MQHRVSSTVPLLVPVPTFNIWCMTFCNMQQNMSAVTFTLLMPLKHTLGNLAIAKQGIGIMTVDNRALKL